MNAGAISQMFPTTPGLDQDLENVGMLLETERDNMELSDLYLSTGKLHSYGMIYEIMRRNVINSFCRR